MPAPLLAELIARGAKVKPLLTPGSAAEPQYRPSKALDEFIRIRDLTCRAPGCDRPAMFGDIDHTVPYPGGPTHFGGLKCYCRKHHLLKTFWPCWRDEFRRNPSLLRRDGEEMPFAGHAVERVGPALLELEP